MEVERGVPEGTGVSAVAEQAPGEDVGVDAGIGVHGVGAGSGIDDGLGGMLVFDLIWDESG